MNYLQQYVDLDEFLSENGIVDGVGGGGQGAMPGSQMHKIGNNDVNGHQGPAGLHLEPVTKRERSPSPSECCSPDTLNPPSPADSSEYSYKGRFYFFIFTTFDLKEEQFFLKKLKSALSDRTHPLST